MKFTGMQVFVTRGGEIGDPLHIDDEVRVGFKARYFSEESGHEEQAGVLFAMHGEELLENPAIMERIFTSAGVAIAGHIRERERPVPPLPTAPLTRRPEVPF